MRKKKRKTDRDISLFPDYDEFVSRAEAEAKRKQEKTKRETKWRQMEDEFITWLFSGSSRIHHHQHENEKIAKIITIDI